MPVNVVTIQPVQPDPRRRVRVAVVVSRYNAWVTDRLRDGAIEEFRRRAPAGGDWELVVIPVPGAFELACAAAVAARLNGERGFDAIVALGCLIKGETRHDEVIADAVAASLTKTSAVQEVPVGLGLLTVNTPDQADERAGGAHGNKGAEAMAAALELLGTLDAMHGRVFLSREQRQEEILRALSGGADSFSESR